MKPARTLLCATAVQAAMYAAPVYRVIDLGPAAHAAAISSTGHVAGSQQNQAGQLHAFISDGRTTADLTSTTSIASAVNASAQVAGTQWTSGAGQASVWSNATITTLGTLGGTESYATAINNLGQVAGNATTTSGDGHAFLYSNGVMEDLGVPAGAFWSSAYGINEAGVIVGYSLASGGLFRGFRWTSREGYTSLGTFGGRNSYAMAVSAPGAITGHAQNALGMLHAFLYDGSAMLDLGTLGGWQSFAYGINSSNSVVGYSLLTDGNAHAFLYRDGILFDLNTMISASGWELTEARAINDLSQIAGTGIFNGELHAFRLDPIPTIQNPEPATYLLAGCALLSLALRKGL